LGLLPHWRYRIVDRIGVPIRDRRIQSVVGIPRPQANFMQVSSDYDYLRNQVLSMGFFVWIIPWTY